MDLDKLKRGFDALEQGDVDEAEQLLRRAVEELPAHSSEAFLASMGVAHAMLARNQHARVLQWLASTPENAMRDEALMAVYQGCAQVGLGRVQEAIASFSAALHSGGTAVFRPVDDKYLRLALESIAPPAGCSSWHDYQPDGGLEDFGFAP